MKTTRLTKETGWICTKHFSSGSDVNIV